MLDYFKNRIIQKLLPLQDGGDDILVEFELGGPESNRDVRLYLEVETLDHLLSVARSSHTGRVVIDKAGIKIKLRRAKSGHQYETLHLNGLQPKPENVSSTLSMPTSRADARRIVSSWKK
jgi:hypothetical protein|tara:strand:- start:88 stop:447 length:360 start_codon:yes stop_codon:yes gene_type:complete